MACGPKGHAISIHALLAESDRYHTTDRVTACVDFYPRSPCGERLLGNVAVGLPMSNFYPRSPCGERRITTITICTASKFLSTLSLRRATLANVRNRPTTKFLSTLSLRRATGTGSHRERNIHHFYPRSPCGERRYLINTYHRIFGISIHALLAESDSGTKTITAEVSNFYPRSPCGERPQVFQRIAKPFRISIHALLAESDTNLILRAKLRPISIHALLAESDNCQHRSHQSCSDFYPRSPCGERPW